MIYWIYSCDYSLLEAPWSKLQALLDFIQSLYWVLVIINLRREDLIDRSWPLNCLSVLFFPISQQEVLRVQLCIENDQSTSSSWYVLKNECRRPPTFWWFRNCFQKKIFSCFFVLLFWRILADRLCWPEVTGTWHVHTTLVIK